MLGKYNLRMPPAVYCGQGSLNEIPKIMAGIKKAAVFTDRGIAETGLLEMPLTQLKAAGKEYVVFEDLAVEPSYQDVQKTVDEFRHSGADFIVAVGGGSVMDAAKLTSVLATETYNVRELLEKPGLAKKCVPSLMIPTTAGTGAEATPNAIVSVPEKEVKIGIVNPEMIADYVVLDPEMIRKLPRKIAASTGVDALCHALECYTGNKANPFSDLFAMEALDLILNHIEKACGDPGAMKEKEQMQIASFYAGVAITASGTTAVHGLSYPLGGKYHIPHGVSNAVLLVPVMRFNETVCKGKFAAVYDRCVHGGDIGISTEKKSAYILEWLERIVERLDIPKKLEGLGVPGEDLEWLVTAGLEQQRLLTNNRREVTAKDARELYRSVM